MTSKKTRINTSKKSGAKKITIAKKAVTKKTETKQEIKKKLNEFGDTDSL
jgi:hypothetical protein